MGPVTERKPADVGWDTWVERKIHGARLEGAFDDLPGHGRPIAGLDEPLDEAWWVREKLRREGGGELPPTLAIRRDQDVAVAEARAAPSEDEARRILEDINARVRHLNSHVISGPPTTVGPVDVDEELARWRETHPPPPPDPTPPPPPPPRRFLARLLPSRRAPRARPTPDG